jgi:aminoglycoside 3-N-acetyltransferase
MWARVSIASVSPTPLLEPLLATIAVVLVLFALGTRQHRLVRESAAAAGQPPLTRSCEPSSYEAGSCCQLAAVRTLRGVDQGQPHTVASLAKDLEALGLTVGDTVLLHSSLRALGFVAGGVHAVLQALLDVLGSSGTLVVPTHTPDNTDPAAWRHPPVPEAWWSVIRQSTPGFDPARTPSRWMGVIAETVRTWPGAVRSRHPQCSFAALGAHAGDVVAVHALADALGEESPLGAVYRLDGKVLLLGCGYDSSTSLHLAEYRQADPPRGRTGSAVLDRTGVSGWVEWDDVITDEADFAALGADFESAGGSVVGFVGDAESRLMSQQGLVDFAVGWMAAHRHRSAGR